jgi:hypothetical protein
LPITISIEKLDNYIYLYYAGKFHGKTEHELAIDISGKYILVNSIYNIQITVPEYLAYVSANIINPNKIVRFDILSYKLYTQIDHYGQKIWAPSNIIVNDTILENLVCAESSQYIISHLNLPNHEVTH